MKAQGLSIETLFRLYIVPERFAQFGFSYFSVPNSSGSFRYITRKSQKTARKQNDAHPSSEI